MKYTTLITVSLALFIVGCGGAGDDTVTQIEPACKVHEVAKLEIVTDSEVTSKEKYVNGSVKFVSSILSENVEVSTQIRGRGNSTWGMPKKPYRLKLKESTSVLGMPAEKDWVLLANYSDKTLMRTAIAFCMARSVGMKWVPENRFVELTMNGEYQGVYQVVPHIEPGEFKANIGEDPGVKFLIEVDARLDGDYPTVTKYGTNLIIKSDAEPDEAVAIYSFINGMEDAIYARSQDPWLIIDRASLVQYYLVSELTRNNDTFWSSTFFYKSATGLVTFGPVWDFDISLGNIDYNNNWLTEGLMVVHTGYIRAAILDDAFVRDVRTDWKKLHANMPAIRQYITDLSASLDSAQKRNFVRWPILDMYVWPNQVVTGSYTAEVKYLTDWLDARAVYLDTVYGPK